MEEIEVDVPTIAATRERRERKQIKYNFDEDDEENHEEKADENFSDDDEPVAQKKTVSRKPKRIDDSDDDDEFKLDSDNVQNKNKKFTVNV